MLHFLLSFYKSPHKHLGMNTMEGTNVLLTKSRTLIRNSSYVPYGTEMNSN